MTTTEVAIIGAGPTGLMLAHLLGARGIGVTILEKQPVPYALPRAVHFDGEVMRILQSAGLAEAALPQTHVNPGMLFKAPDGRVLVDWSRDPSIGPMGWHESYRCHQPGLEAVMRAELARYPHVSLRMGVAVSGVEQGRAGVTLATSAGPLDASYAIACDGAGSPLREALGISVEDLGFRERWLVVDLQLTTARPDLGDHTIQHCDPESPATYVRGVGDRRRWEMRLAPADGDTVPEAEIWARLSRWITPEEAQLERAAVYTFRSRVAEQWRDGRVFLAGDAAHQMPPFMGQGMCAGFRDAANLAWKLAAVLRGTDPELLGTYETERAPNVRAFIDLSVKLGRLINRTATGAVPEGRLHSIWPSLGPGLGPRDEVSGGLAPQLIDASGMRSDDTSATGFHALTLGPCELPIPQTDAPEWLAEAGVFGALIRPDGYVLCTAADPDDLRRSAEEWRWLWQGLPERRSPPGA